jgi:hypothetical protein
MKTTCKELVKPDELSVREFAILEVAKITVPSALHTLSAYLQEEELRAVRYHLYVTVKLNTGVITGDDREAYNKTEQMDLAWIKGNLIGRLLTMNDEEVQCFLDVLVAEARKGYIW